MAETGLVRGGRSYTPTWKMELHTLTSVTLSDQQFLTGEGEGRPVTLTAALRLPTPMGRLPLVVLMHGSGRRFGLRR